MKKLLLSLLCLLLCACAPAAPVITAEPTPIPIEENAPAPTPKATPIVVADGKAADVLVVSTGSRYGLADSAGKLIAAPIYSNIRKISGERLILTIENADGLPLHALALQTGERLTDHIYAEIVELGNGMGRAKCRETGETHIIGLDTGLVLAALPAHIDLAGICPANATMLAVDTEKGCAVC